MPYIKYYDDVIISSSDQARISLWHGKACVHVSVHSLTFVFCSETTGSIGIKFGVEGPWV